MSGVFLILGVFAHTEVFAPPSDTTQADTQAKEESGCEVCFKNSSREIAYSSISLLVSSTLRSSFVLAFLQAY